MESSNISFSTNKGYRWILNCLKKYIPQNSKIKDITLFDMKIIRKQLSEQVAPKSINNIIGLCSGIFNEAIREKIISENPAKGLFVTVPKEEVVPFTPAEMKDIIRTAYEIRPDIAIYFAIAFYTGARSGEILALKREDFDLKQHKIKICKTISNGVFKNSTKTNKIRYLDIVPDLDPYIEAHFKHMNKNRYEKELLMSEKGSGVVNNCLLLK
jgi:integrase